MQNYQLIDFGRGRKLERFGDILVDRPCPAADGLKPLEPAIWKTAQAHYRRIDDQQGRWRQTGELPPDWAVSHAEFRLQLKLTPFGHLGVFPEQRKNWDWIARQVRRASRPLNVLNLFAYTGGSTLAAAAAGCEVVHVDAAKNVVSWARENARCSGLESAPIRWIVEDAATFVRRELRRGNHYDAVILDPPSYGHGPKGQAWNVNQDLAELLENCAALTADRRAFYLLTCHSPNFGPAELQATLADAVFGSCQAGAKAKRLQLVTSDNRRLDAGVVARWPGS